MYSQMEKLKKNTFEPRELWLVERHLSRNLIGLKMPERTDTPTVDLECHTC